MRHKVRCLKCAWRSDEEVFGREMRYLMRCLGKIRGAWKYAKVLGKVYGGEVRYIKRCLG